MDDPFLSLETLKIGERNGAPGESFLEQLFDELQDWEDQLKHADIDWCTLDNPGVDDPIFRPSDTPDLE